MPEQTPPKPLAGTPRSADYKRKLRTYGRRLGAFCLFELCAIFLTVVGSGPSYEEYLNWFTSVNVTAAVLVAVWIVTQKRKAAYGPARAAKRTPKWQGLMWLALLFGTPVGWQIVVFPWVIQTALQHDGVNASAVITGSVYYQYGGNAHGGVYTRADTADQADSIQIHVKYDGHSSTIFIHENDTDFQLVQSALRTSGRKLPVRYLRQLPDVVRITAVSY